MAKLTSFFTVELTKPSVVGSDFVGILAWIETNITSKLPTLPAIATETHPLTFPRLGKVLANIAVSIDKAPITGADFDALKAFIKSVIDALPVANATYSEPVMTYIP